MKRCIIIGASSGLGRGLAELLLSDGWMLGIAARRTERLEEIQNKSPQQVIAQKLDVTKPEATQQLRQLIKKLGGMDLFIYSVGIGKRNPDLEEETEMATMTTNVMGFTRTIGEAYRYFAAQGSGHIVSISSVAGTKGLGTVPAYSASKALQKTYIEALEQLANKRGLRISFTDIRPGFVSTEILVGDDYPMLMTIPHATRCIWKAIRRKRHVAIIDWRWNIFTRLWALIPRCIWRRIKL